MNGDNQTTNKAGSLSREERRGFIEQCNPRLILPSHDPRYVDLDSPMDGQPGARGTPHCTEKLFQTIAVADRFRPTCQLFTGFPGVGKTTELRRLQDRLENDSEIKAKVIHVAFSDYHNIYEPISVADLLRVLAHVLDMEAAEVGATRAVTYAQQLWELLRGAEPDLPPFPSDVAASAPSATARTSPWMTIYRDDPYVRELAAEAIRKRFQPFAQAAQNAIGTALGELQRKYPRVVVLVDDLEKLSPLNEQEVERMEKSVEITFVQNSSWLFLPCDVVYTFPIWLRFRAKLEEHYNRKPLVLPTVRAVDKHRAPDRVGVQKLIDIVERRVDVERVFGGRDSPELEKLVLASGGYMGDLLTLLREVIYELPENKPIEANTVSQVIRDKEYSYRLMVNDREAKVLAEVDSTQEIPTDETDRITFSRLVENRAILSYRNGDEWFDLHPLVRNAPVVRKAIEHINREKAP
ncbi:MAG: AAA family ATPase [Polyangiaceae bacterium]|nr:AAA family ATPase [Polyangiaceae bacterium]